MYESYYGFTANPFRIAPDPSFFFASTGHKRGLAYLRYGLHQGQGFVVVTGEPGTGKTMLIHTLLAELSGDEYRIATISNTNLRTEDFLRAVAENFGIDQRAANNKAELISGIQKFLVEQHEAGKKCLLIVDEAHNLPPRSLEELRMLSNFQVGHQALLQTMLAAQPQLRKTLAAPSMEQFSQRIIAGCHLKPLPAAETRGYVGHRLQRVGWSGTPSFSGAAMAKIFQISRGIPRLINIISDRLLLAACIEERDSIDETLVAKVVKELKQEGGGSWMRADAVADVVEAEEKAALAPLPAQEQPAARQASGGGAAASSVAAPQPQSGSAPAPAVKKEQPAKQRPAAPAKRVAKASPQGEGKKRKPKIVKAVASAGEGQAASPQLVQVKWPKDEGQKSDGQKQSRKEASTKRIQKTRAAAPNPQPTPQPSSAHGGHASAEPTAVELTLEGDESKVIELPLPKKAKPKGRPEPRASEQSAEKDEFDDLFEPVPPPSTAPEADAVAQPMAGHDPFGQPSSKGSKKSLVLALAGLAIAGGFAAFLMSGSGEQAVPVAQKAAPVVAPDADTLAAAQAPTPAPESLVNGDEEGGRSSIFDPRSRVAVAPAPEEAAQEPLAPVNPAAVEAPPAKAAAPVPEQSSAAAPAPAFDTLPEWELADLMYTYILAYENGNLSLFNTLFTQDAVYDEFTGKSEISRYHATLFKQSSMRSVAINDIEWTLADGFIRGEGVYETTLWRDENGEPESRSGRIVIEVVRNDGRLQIRRVEHL